MPSIFPGAMSLVFLATASLCLADSVASSSFIRGHEVNVDITWHPPAKSKLNDLNSALHGTGVYGFIFNTSATPDDEYGTYNWCNMPHVRRTEYVRASDEFELQYVEVMQRHHKRTPYASNAFPVESYPWSCDDSRLFLYGQPGAGPNPAPVFRQGYISPSNPFTPSGWIGSCAFPQITSGGLVDSWQHGADLFGVYHDLLGFLPAKTDHYKSVVRYRVTNNVITSQVAGMLINGMWSMMDPYPLITEALGVDSLEPQYSCHGAEALFNGIKSSQNPEWANHLSAAAELYRRLDDISGVPVGDSGFHSSFDHYYDNLSARQCHSKPLPCKLVNGANSTACVSQALADSVYRIGNWEYSQIYRDHPSSLKASALSLGVWIGQLASHIRNAIAGSSEVIYFHNVAHDGSVSRLLSILQIDEMVWPGMGSEVIFELYKKKPVATKPPPSPTPSSLRCHHDNCLRELIRQPASASPLCQGLNGNENTSAVSASWPTHCLDRKQLSSACSCLTNQIISTKTETMPATATATVTSNPDASLSNEHYIRVLFGGKVLKSSNPTLGSIDMIPVDVLLGYFDGLVGRAGASVPVQCRG